MEAFESRVFDLPDFYFTGDDYRYRFDPVAKGRFLNLLRERFNSGVKYNSLALKWDTIIVIGAENLGLWPVVATMFGISLIATSGTRLLSVRA